MSEPEDPQEYNNSTLCKWEENKMKCKNDAVKDGYCQEHSERMAQKVAAGAIAGGGIGALLANPVVLTIGAVAGIALVLYLSNKDR